MVFDDADGVSHELYTQSKNYVYKLLAMRDYARAEVDAKLAARDVPPSLRTDLLDKFSQAGLIDDARFAEAFVRSKRAGRGLARKGLASELAAKGVASEVIDDALAHIGPDDDESAARRLVENKAPSSRGLDRTRRMRRLLSLLGRKGYPQGLSMRVVESVLADEEVDVEAD